MKPNGTRDNSFASPEEKQNRIKWLVENKTLWHGIVDPFKPKPCMDQITVLSKKMQDAGLYSQKTWIGDIRIGVIKFLQKIVKG